MSTIRPRDHTLSQTEINEVVRPMQGSGERADAATKHALLRRQGAVARELAAWRARQAAAGGVPRDDGTPIAVATDAGAPDAPRPERRS